MITEFIKIPNGLRWDNTDRYFTYSILPSGYETFPPDLANIELDNQLFVLCTLDSTVNGQSFTDIQDEIDFIYS